MSHYKYLVFLLTFFLFFGLTSASSQNLPDKSFLLVAPLKANTTHHNLLKGFQQIVIDELGRITGKDITDRELIIQFLREQGTGKEPFTVYHTDVPDLTGHLNAEKTLLMDFNEKYGKVSIKIKFAEGSTGNTISKEETKGVLGAFPKLEKDVLDAILSILGFLGDTQIQKRAAEGPKCLLEGVAIFGKGLDYLDKGSLENAAKYFQRTIALNPTLTSAHRQLKQVFKKAEEDFFEPADLGMVYLQGGEITQAKSYFTEALDQNTSDIKGLIGMGKILLEENKLEKSSKNLQTVLQLDENNLAALILLARVYKTQKKYPQAISLIERAIKIDPASLDLNMVAGEVYEEAQKKDKAIQHYIQVARFLKKELDIKNCLNYLKKIKQLAPEEATPFLIEGDLKVSLGDYQGAVKVYEVGRDVSPDNDEVHQKLAFAYQKIGDTQKALGGYQKALALNQKNVNAHLGLGDLKREEKKYADAIKHYSQAEKLAPENEEPILMLAKTYTAADKPDEAILKLIKLSKSDESRVVGGSPTRVMTHKLLADNYKKKGDLQKAKKHLKKAIQIDPDYVPAYKALGMVETSLGKSEEAKKAFAKAKKLDPSLEVSPKKIPAQKKGENLIMLNEDFVRFLLTFPVDPPKEIASVVINRDILKPGLFKHFKAHLGFTREEWGTIYQDLNNALLVQYKLIAPTTTETILNKQPFNRISIEDIDDDDYMAMFCEAMAADGIFFYRVEKIESPEEEINFKLHAVLFHSREQRLISSLDFYYPEKLLKKINWLFSILIFLLISGGITYGIIYFRQGFGNLQVNIERDPKASAYFSLKLSKNPNVDLTKMKRSLSDGIEERACFGKTKFGSKTEKSMVEKDCRFENIHVGHYFVYLYGVILDSSGNKIGNYQITRKVVIEKCETAELTFALLPKIYVGVQVMEGEHPATGAEISVKGKPGAKYIKDDRGVFFDLEPGQYLLLIHYKKKAFSKKISISSIDNFNFNINLGGKV